MGSFSSRKGEISAFTSNAGSTTQGRGHRPSWNVLCSTTGRGAVEHVLARHKHLTHWEDRSICHFLGHMVLFHGLRDEDHAPYSFSLFSIQAFLGASRGNLGVHLGNGGSGSGISEARDTGHRRFFLVTRRSRLACGRLTSWSGAATQHDLANERCTIPAQHRLFTMAATKRRTFEPPALVSSRRLCHQAVSIPVRSQPQHNEGVADAVGSG
nr:hypothetical protein CFP56_11626 [Quercus suber]